MRSIPHSDQLPVSHPPIHLVVEDESQAAMEFQSEKQDVCFETSISTPEPHLLR